MSDVPDTIAGERHAETPPAARRISRRHSVLAIGLAAAVVAAFFAFRGGGTSDHPKQEASQPTRIGSVLSFEPAKPTAELGDKKPPQPDPFKPSLTPGEIAADTLEKARAAPLIRRQQQQPQQQRPAAPVAIADREGAAQPQSELEGKLQTTLPVGSKAAVLPDPDMTITMGTLIPCTLQTAMDSSAPGLVTCVTQADVLGTTGDVVLMERGTKIVGEYSSRLAHGQNRMFVRWTRAETPSHVVITLGSSASDALGRAGFDGQVDKKFWERFEGALLITLINGAFSTASQLASKEGSTSFNLSSGESVATEALRSTVNIPPVLRKNQGEAVAVMVARDLSFAGVYGLQLRAGVN